MVIWAKRLGIELGTLLASLLKWTLLAVAAGALAGASTALFLRILTAAIAAAQSLAMPLPLLPLGFAVGALIVHVLAPDAEGHGTDKVIEAVHRRWGRIPFALAPVKLVATVITIASGGSVGKERPGADRRRPGVRARSSALLMAARERIASAVRAGEPLVTEAGRCQVRSVRACDKVSKLRGLPSS